MLRFKLKCYPGTESENNLDIHIGTVAEISPNDKNYENPNQVYGFSIFCDKVGTRGIISVGFKDRLDTEAAAMLRALSYGNGGFPLDNHYRRSK